MNWEAVGAIGEILGALAVFGSLVYLAAQIRVQNRESKALGIHEISEAFRESVTSFSQSDLAEAFARFEAGTDVTDAERIQLNAVGQKLMRVWEEAYHQRHAGRLDEKVWHVIELQYKQFLASKMLTHFWDLRKDFFDPDFRDYVDTMEKGEYIYK